MKRKVSELSGDLLDAAVAKAEGCLAPPPPWWNAAERGEWQPIAVHSYSTEWQDGGPIIERELIRITPDGGGENRWQAECTGFPYAESDAIWHGIGPTPLIAAMRAYVASRFGEEVELP